MVFQIQWNRIQHDFTMRDGHHRDLLLRQAASTTTRSGVTLEEVEGGDCPKLPYGGFHSHEGIPTWMVDFMENPMKMDDVGVPIF